MISFNSLQVDHLYKQQVVVYWNIKVTSSMRIRLWKLQLQIRLRSLLLR